ncbi:MAG: DNA recombination protein RmuC [Phycisphaerales bacterium]
MDAVTIVLGVLLLAALAGVVILLVQRGTLVARANAAEALRTAAAQEAESARVEAARLGARLEQIEAERKRGEEQLQAIKAEFTSVFKALASDTLRSSSADFLRLAEQKLGEKSAQAAAEMEQRRSAVEHLVKPIADTLAKTDAVLRELENARGAAYAGLMQQVRTMQDLGGALRSETGKLVRALGKPDVRGKYGEWHLRRVVEMAGLAEGRDFRVQDSTVDADGKVLKPDMIVFMPNDRNIVIDAKCNISAYVEAIDKEGAERDACLERFARHVTDQVTALGKKGYYAEYPGSPEFVVMFIPGDQYLDAVQGLRPELIEHAWRNKVVIVTPTTLLGLLSAVALTLQEQKLAEEAATLRTLGSELHQRVQVALAHAVGLGKALNAAVDRYNDFIASTERNLLSTARRFEREGVKSGKALQTDDAMAPITVRAEAPTKAAAMLPFEADRAG